MGDQWHIYTQDWQRETEYSGCQTSGINWSEKLPSIHNIYLVTSHKIKIIRTSYAHWISCYVDCRGKRVSTSRGYVNNIQTHPNEKYLTSQKVKPQPKIDHKQINWVQ